MSDTERTEFELPPGVGPSQNADLDPQQSAGESDIDTSLRPKSLDEFCLLYTSPSPRDS